MTSRAGSILWIALAPLSLLAASCGGINASGCPLNGDYQPTWSPAGARITYVHATCSSSKLYTVDVDGSHRHELPVPAIRGDDQFAPAWSPDGTRLAFVGGNGHEVFVMDAEGAHARKLGPGGGGLFAGLSWSPDGSSLAFSVTDVYSRNAVLVVARADGRRRREIASIEGGEGGIETAWSPDGRWIAAEAGQGIALFSPDGTRRRTLVPNGCGPAWSPDSRTLIYTGRGGLRLMQLDATRSRLLSWSAAVVGGPCEQSRSRDGQALAFLSRGHVYAAHLDGTGLRQVS